MTNAFSLVVLFTFPDGRFAPGWLRLPALALIAAVCVASLTILDPSRGTGPGILAQLAFVACLALAVATQVYRYVRVSRSLQRQQTKWVVFGFFIVLAGFATSFPLMSKYQSMAAPAVPWLARVANDFILSMASLALPVTITIAILEYRLFDVDVVIRRTLVYGAVTATLVVVYVSAIFALQRVFQSLTGQQSDLAIVASTLLIAALFSPVRRWVQFLVDRRFYRRRYNTTVVLSSFARTIRDEVELDRLAAQLLRVVDDTMEPAHVMLWLAAQTKTARPVTSADPPSAGEEQRLATDERVNDSTAALRRSVTPGVTIT